MSERNGFRAGVPCWIDTWQPDAEAAVGFYTDLFGWESEGGPVPGSSRKHFMCTLRGRDVAAIGSPAPEGMPPTWGTYIWVDDVDATAAKVKGAGGSLVMEPFDSLDGGRMAVAADPSGAVFGLWRPRAHPGVQAVNEAGAWCWSQLYTDDPDASLAFYHQIFGWGTEMFGDGEAATTMFKVPGYFGGRPQQPVSRDVVAGMAPLREGDLKPHWRVEFWVDGVDAVVAAAVRLGGAVVVPAQGPADNRVAVLVDPQGAVFAISPAPPA